MIMPKSVLQQGEQASRVRENKRRHRARRKEYVQDLEQRVAQAHEHGIKATIEVQLAAQRVAHENVKLRSLLQNVGVSDAVIKAWVSGNASSDASKQNRPIPRVPTGRSVQKLTLASGLKTEKAGRKSGNEEHTPSPSSEIDMSGQGMRPQQTSFSSTESSLLKGNTEAEQTVVAGNCMESPSRPEIRKPATAPCRLLASLAGSAAQGPRADIGDDSSNGMECSAAYSTLMQYATSQDKMDRIAAALDYGCTPSEAGGCKVKRSVIWKILDEEC